MAFPTINLADYAGGQQCDADIFQTELAAGLQFVERACMKGGWPGLDGGYFNIVLDRMVSARFMMPVDCRIKEIILFSGVYVGNIKCAIYDDSGGSPDALLKSSGAQAVTVARKQLRVSLSDYVDLTGGNNYWMSILADATIEFRTAFGSSIDWAVYYSNSGQYAAGFPDPHPTGLAHSVPAFMLF